MRENRVINMIFDNNFAAAVLFSPPESLFLGSERKHKSWLKIITPYISQTQQANSPATSPSPKSLPHGNAPREANVKQTVPYASDFLA